MNKDLLYEIQDVNAYKENNSRYLKIPSTGKYVKLKKVGAMELIDALGNVPIVAGLLGAKTKEDVDKRIDEEIKAVESDTETALKYAKDNIELAGKVFDYAIELPENFKWADLSSEDQLLMMKELLQTLAPSTPNIDSFRGEEPQND